MGVITAISLIATSQARTSWQLYFTYSLLLAAGTGAVYSVLMTTTQRWFHKRRGTAIGIVGAGVGVGTIIMTPLIAYLIDVYDWRVTYLAIGIVLGAIFVTLSIPLKRDPSDIGLLPDGITQAPQQVAASGLSQPAGKSYTVAEAMQTANFWLIAFIWFLWAFSLLLVMTHLVPHLTDIGLPATSAALIAGLIGVVSTAGRLGTGWISDRLERKITNIITVLLQAGGLLLLAWANQMWMFYLFVVIYSIGYGGLDPVSLALVGDIFGTRHLGKILGVLLIFWPFGAGLGSVAGGILYDTTGSYFVPFLLTAILMTMAGIGAVFIRKK
jgi:MFS family permease